MSAPTHVPHPFWPAASRKPAPLIPVHTFPTTGEAYDATQVRDDQWRQWYPDEPPIHSGDILYIPGERVVGYLSGAWPIAVTVNAGNFHRVTGTPDSANHAAACKLARELGIALA